MFVEVFRADHARETGFRHTRLRIYALLVKRFHVLRRQYIFLLGFFLLPVLVEILLVSILPTPKQIQPSLAQNDRVKDAQRTLLPTMYNPQTIVTYSNNDGNNAQARLNDYLQSTGATIDEISNNTILDYVRERYLETEDIFINKYQMGIALYNNLTSLTFNTYFSTVNYHAMATSLSIASTSLFQFYANSSTKQIVTTNEPILTVATSFSALQRFLEIIYCFDTIPVSLFNFINSILAALFISILITPLIQERINHSKDLQLLTNLSKRTYWLSNFVFDFLSCIALCAVLTIIVKVNFYEFYEEISCFVLFKFSYRLVHLQILKL